MSYNNPFGKINQPPVGYGAAYGSYGYSTSTTSSNNKPSTTTTTSYGYQDPYSKQIPGYGGNSYGTPGYGTSYSYGTPSYGTSTAGGYGGYTQPTASYQTYQPTVPSTSYSYGGSTQPQPTYPTAGGNAAPISFGGYGTYGGNAGTTAVDPYAKPRTDNATIYTQQNIKPAQDQLSLDEINDLSKAGKQLFSNAFAKSSTKSAYQDLLKQLQASGQKYKDLDFPNELRSLTGGLSDYELAASGNPLNWRSLIWLRADDIFGKGTYKVFVDTIEPNDIKQGSLGDCYFLSTLSAIAEKPERIRRLFESPQVNEHGVYAVRICDLGVWTTVILDDYIPCSAKSRQPVFTRGNGSELWVLLLEKAWAKTYGSYARIEAGLTRECLHDLTGAPTKYYLTGDPTKYDEIWKAIADGEKKDFIMTAGSGDFFEGADLMSSVGLVGSHAYSLLSAVEIKDKYGATVKLIQLRNPWGKGEWTGEWSDESPRWTEDLKRQLNLEDKDDGIFHMSFEDFVKYFSDIQICKCHDDFIYKSLKTSQDHKHATYFKLTVKTPGHYYVTINQESKRKHEEKENYKYSDIYLVFGKKISKGYEYVEGIQKADKEVWTDGHLTAGEYIVYAKTAWTQQRSKEFSISAYGAGEVDIEQVPKTYCPDFIEKVYLNKARQSKKFEDYKHAGVANCYRAVELTDDGFGFIYYRNESGKALEEELYFKYLEGLKLRKPYRGNNYKISVPGGQERIVVTKILPNASRIRQAFTERARFV